MTRIFFPDFAVGARSGLCIGWLDRPTRTVCVLAVVHLPFDPHVVSAQLKMATSVRQRPLAILGPLTHRADPDRVRLRRLCRPISPAVCLQLDRPDLCSLPSCTLLGDGRPPAAARDLIVYGQRRVCACRPPGGGGGDGNANAATPPGSGTERDALETERDALGTETILSIIREGVRQLRTVTDWDLSVDGGTESSVVRRAFAPLASVLVSMATVSLLPLRSDVCCRVSRSPVFQRVLGFTQTGCRIQAKYGHLQDLLDAFSAGGSSDSDGVKETTKRDERQARCDYLRTGNLWTYLLIDMLLGVFLMWWIQCHSRPDVWAQWISSTASTTAGSLQTLLQWLMGAPAGLKLNSALAHFLGQFFQYHVYLWIGYLSIIQPVLGWAIWCMSLTGCLGASVTLAVAVDMVSMLTFHVYCFYVYAARIYRLQLIGLLALWRLFRGKKWNVLRKRIDTCNYDVDQLFIGTLLFTILLFLLPTTMLFYAVFTLQRLVVIFLVGILTKTIDFLKWLPVFSILLWLVDSDALASGVYFDLLRHPGQGSPQALVMRVPQMSLYDVLLLTHNSSTKTSATAQPESSLSAASRNPVISLALDLLTGCLIYPWGIAQNKH